MKIVIFPQLGILVVVVTLNLALSPGLSAQQVTSSPSNPSNPGSTNGSTENTKLNDSVAERRNATTSADLSTGQGTLDKNPTKSPNENPNMPSTERSSASTESSSSNASEQKNGSLDKSDKKFIEDAAQGGMTEVQLGQIAQEKGSSADVKQFGSRMVTDHSKADDELKALAQQKGVTLPTTLDHKHQAMVDHFKNLSGPAFDRAYVHNMVKDHQADVTEFQKASTSAQDPDVKAFAGRTLEVVKSHLSDAQSIQSKLQ